MEAEIRSVKNLIRDLEVSLAGPESVDPQEFRKNIVHCLKEILDQTDALDRKLGRLESLITSMHSGL